MALKVFITRSGNANFSCPECGQTRQMDVSKYRNVDKEVKLKYTCTCKHVFSVILERRKHVRKDVNLNGEIILGNKRYPVNVKDISRLGLKIRTKGILDLHLQDKVAVEFILDDAGGSRVSKEVIIRKIDQADLGVEFVSHDHYDKLGTYLLFHFN
ncbi:MAG: PilZ domain-containing protein [Desulfobacula sp.]|nr:PilZ domain-containing protein [Desulfobacula sp.]